MNEIHRNVWEIWFNTKYLHQEVKQARVLPNGSRSQYFWFFKLISFDFHAKLLCVLCHDDHRSNADEVLRKSWKVKKTNPEKWKWKHPHCEEKTQHNYKPNQTKQENERNESNNASPSSDCTSKQSWGCLALHNSLVNSQNSSAAQKIQEGKKMRRGSVFILLCHQNGCIDSSRSCPRLNRS